MIKLINLSHLYWAVGFAVWAVVLVVLLFGWLREPAAVVYLALVSQLARLAAVWRVRK